MKCRRQAANYTFKHSETRHFVKLGTQPDVRHDLKKAFDFVAKHDFNHIELLLDHPLYSLEYLNPKDVLELKSSYDIELLLHAPSANTNFIALSSFIRRASYEELKRTCEFAEKCEAKVVTFHIGWNPGFINAGKFYFDVSLYDKHNEKVLRNEMYKFLKDLDTNCILALENTVLIERGLESALNFLLENTDLALTFDVGHNNIVRNEFFIKNFNRVVNIHLHDNNGKRDEHLALGKGNVNLNEIPLKSYKNYLTIETREENAIIETKNYLIRWLNEGQRNRV